MSACSAHGCELIHPVCTVLYSRLCSCTASPLASKPSGVDAVLVLEGDVKPTAHLLGVAQLQLVERVVEHLWGGVENREWRGCRDVPCRKRYVRSEEGTHVVWRGSVVRGMAWRGVAWFRMPSIYGNGVVKAAMTTATTRNRPPYFPTQHQWNHSATVVIKTLATCAGCFASCLASRHCKPQGAVPPGRVLAKTSKLGPGRDQSRRSQVEGGRGSSHQPRSCRDFTQALQMTDCCCTLQKQDSSIGIYYKLCALECNWSIDI